MECDKIMYDESYNDYERGILITGLLFGEESPYCEEALEKARIFLTAGNSDTDGKRVLDFTQHWDYYYGAFRAQYGIDLNKEELHYHEFVSLLKTVKNQSLNDIVELLTYDLSKVKDHNEKRKIIDAQNKVKIKTTDKNDDKNDEIKNDFISQLAPTVKGG